MSDLIRALTIFLKYGDPKYPTSCEHDVLYVFVDPASVSPEDLAELDTLGFHPHHDPGVGSFESHRYGSA